MRIAFMGTPDFAVPTLDALLAAGHDIAAVYSQPPRRAGRGKALSPTPVHRRAEALGIAVRTPLTLRDPDTQAAFAALDLDVAVVAAYGLILPRAVLDTPRHGCLNVHASLLPRWRGAAPIVRAIEAGDDETGVCIMGMEAGLDTGPVFARVATPIGTKTGGELTDELAHAGAAAMVAVLADLAAHVPVPQPEEGVTYARKIEKAEALIDFTADAAAVVRQIQAYDPVPGAFCEHEGERLRLFRAGAVAGNGAPGTVLDSALTIACGSGAIRPAQVQRAGRGAMTPDELLRGFALPPGTRLTGRSAA
ncbi:methionyl-tRNA formyltransferase [Sphingomonas sanxanigenens]|uniref:Methionyl-tRNA formyltransferase n=1 Tax=Sphingomonas sanxanigenens DSM 19645 = NX02 TaxID=1123269 RepID=W0ABF1_9SPHN|nr:methionyl-tRNA formyltransferase [Sphingomonas sanxanigenens]AHE53832.1 hypothetical protein NX02_10575 [Sphingomonas sanxanigenens DSM 19645 = NX02]